LIDGQGGEQRAAAAVAAAEAEAAHLTLTLNRKRRRRAQVRAEWRAPKWMPFQIKQITIISIHRPNQTLRRIKGT